MCPLNIVNSVKFVSLQVIFFTSLQCCFVCVTKREGCYLLPGCHAVCLSSSRASVSYWGCVATSVTTAALKLQGKLVKRCHLNILLSLYHCFSVVVAVSLILVFSCGRLTPQTPWLSWFLTQTRLSTSVCSSTVSCWMVCPWTHTRTAASSIQSSPLTLWSQSTPLQKYVVSEQLIGMCRHDCLQLINYKMNSGYYTVC